MPPCIASLRAHHHRNADLTARIHHLPDADTARKAMG
jgi:hypothetical protein